MTQVPENKVKVIARRCDHPGCLAPLAWRALPHRALTTVIYSCEAHLAALLPRDRPWDLQRIEVETAT